MRIGKKSKICIGVTAIVTVTVSAVLVVLFLTLLKPKEPKITAQASTLEDFNYIFFPVKKLNVTLGIIITVTNPNYGSFKYHEGIAYICYHGNVVAESPIEDDTIPARGNHNINTTMKIFAEKVVTDPNFEGDYSSGILNFTSTTTLNGKVSMLKVFKAKATSESTCNISLFTHVQRVYLVCKSKVRL